MNTRNTGVRLQLQPRAGLPRLRSFIQRSVDVATFGLAAGRTITSLPAPFQDGAIAYHPDGAAKNSFHAVQQEFEDWLVASCLRDTIEALNEFLIVVGQACVGLQIRLQPSASVDEVRESLRTHDKRFSAMGLPAKLDYIQTATNTSVIPEAERHIRVINRCRNCLVHRLGFVSTEDVRNENSLDVNLGGV